MRISYRIILINFAIVILVLGSAGFAFYSVMFKVMTGQQSRHLLNAANDFILALDLIVRDADGGFASFRKYEGEQRSEVFDDNPSIDFAFRVVSDSLVDPDAFYAKPGILVPASKVPIAAFLRKNPFLLIKSERDAYGAEWYYGINFTKELINTLARRVRSEVAVFQDSLVEYSNETTNQSFFYDLNLANNDLASRNNFFIYSQETETSYFLATVYRVRENTYYGMPLRVILFSTLDEASGVKESIRAILIITGISGALVSLLLTYLFTGTIRMQIRNLTEATEITKTGNFHSRISVSSGDELGDLATAFNTMLTELERAELAKNEYTEFISLLNQNPALQDLGPKALARIVTTTGYVIGALYTVENNSLNCIATYGVDGQMSAGPEQHGLLMQALRKEEIVEYKFTGSPARVTAGVVALELRELLVVPVAFSGKVIAVLELGAAQPPYEGSREYLEKIREQLAIGLANATTLSVLQNIVTELRRLNDEYQKQNEQIKQQNLELRYLHSELKGQADELEVQKRKAEESTEMKSRFLATMSHELRTPMNTILGLTELMLDDPALSAKGKERLSMILRSAKRLLTLINAILDLSKIEAGKMEVRLEQFNLNEVLLEVEDTLAPAAREKGLEFICTPGSAATTVVRTDRGKLLQLLINLVSNAVKFTETGFIRLQAAILPEGRLEVTVEDSGIGIPVEEQQYIFEEFRQVDGSSTRKFGGTGLGLSICAKFVSMLNGTIGVKSERGMGAVFSFTIPVEIAGDAPQVPQQSIHDEKVVLVVTGTGDGVDLFAESFSPAGYDVITTSYITPGISRLRLAVVIVDLPSLGQRAADVLLELAKQENICSAAKIFISIREGLVFRYPFNDFIMLPASANVLQCIRGRLSTQGDALHWALYTESGLPPLNRGGIPKEDTVTYGESPAYPVEQADIHVLTTVQAASLHLLNIRGDVVICMDGTAMPLEKTRIQAIISATGNEFITADVFFESLRAIYPGIKIPAPPVPPDPLPELMQSETKNALVLIVDDDAESLFTLNEIVKQCGYRTMVARNGRECLEVLEANLPDVLLLDIMMPEMDGFQVIRKLRADPAFASLPVIAVTAKAMIDEKDIILRNGFTGYISKPVNAGVLAFRLTKIIGV